MEELIVKKSIFKQKQFKELYFKDYYEDGKPSKFLNSRQEEISEEYKFECNLVMPLLELGKIFYIEEDDKLVKIKNVIRTSKDNVLYECCANVMEDSEEKIKLKNELAEEIKIWDKNHPEVTGFRKFIKNLFKL